MRQKETEQARMESADNGHGNVGWYPTQRDGTWAAPIDGRRVERRRLPSEGNEAIYRLTIGKRGANGTTWYVAPTARSVRAKRGRKGIHLGKCTCTLFANSVSFF